MTSLSSTSPDLRSILLDLLYSKTLLCCDTFQFRKTFAVCHYGYYHGNIILYVCRVGYFLVIFIAPQSNKSLRINVFPKIQTKFMTIFFALRYCVAVVELFSLSSLFILLDLVFACYLNASKSKLMDAVDKKARSNHCAHKYMRSIITNLKFTSLTR